MGVYVDTYRPGASVPYVRATHPPLLRAVRAGDTGQLASGPPRTVRTPYAHQPRACHSYRFTVAPRWECKVDTEPEVFQAFIDGPDGPGQGALINKCYKVMPGAILPPSHFKAKCLFHAKEPGPRFREDFDRYPSLIESDLFERILCPRIHTKAIIVDGREGFIGSANLTGAGVGAKSPLRRNFEAGFITDEKKHLGPMMEWIDQLYLGDFCQSCQRRDTCPDPIA